MQALCPGCNYDLAGLRPEGTGEARSQCPECGREVDWAAIDAAGGVPWLYESAPARRLALGRFLATTVRLLWPVGFWRRVRPEVPVRPGRLVLWLALLLVGSYLLSLAAISAERAGQLRDDGTGVGMTEPLLPYGSKLEFFAPRVYDQGETSPAGTVVPLWLPDRDHPGLAVGSVVAGLTLVCLVETRRRAGTTARHVARATVYGLAPLALVFVMTAVWMTANALELWSVPFGRTGRLWLGRVSRGIDYAAYAWLILYWWAAARIGLRLPRLVAVVAPLVAVLGAAIVILGYWRLWAWWMHAF